MVMIVGEDGGVLRGGGGEKEKVVDMGGGR